MMKIFEQIKNRLLPGSRRNSCSLGVLFGRFQRVLELNNKTLTTIASMHNKLGGGYIFDVQYLRSSKQNIVDTVRELLDAFDAMAPDRYPELYSSFRDIRSKLDSEINRHPVLPDVMAMPFEAITIRDMDAVGAKNTRLAVMANANAATVPFGFAITTTAYRLFMEDNNLREIIKKNEDEWRAGTKPAKNAFNEISSYIMSGNIPGRIRRAINRELDTLRRKVGDKELLLAVRSSAWGEDGNLSFAGQYESYLNVKPEDLHETYKKVIASTYCPAAMEYRREYDFKQEEVYMAVSVQAMVKARTSGVMYSLSPMNPALNCIDIAGTWGLGAPVVSGEVTVDRFTVSRDSEHKILSRNIVEKDKAMNALNEGDVAMEEVPEESRLTASLSDEEIFQMAEMAMRLERYFKKPQDIEYAYDRDDNLVILQSRPLRIEDTQESEKIDLSDALKKYPVLLSGEGDVAQQGVGSGPVFVAWESRDLESCPDGAILVAHLSSPQYASILHRISGVITDIGSPLGHMATIAREYRVPTLLNASRATMVLEEGDVVTLDAEQKTVYQGMVKELSLHDFMSEHMEETYEYRLLRRLLKLIEPLNLLDPEASNFTPLGCQTLHDIARFIHEKSVEILIDIPNISGSEEGCPGGRLQLPVPIDLVVLDIGGGLSPECAGGLKGVKLRRTILPEQVKSETLQAFIEGVTLEGVWQSSPVAVDFSSFMSSMTRTFSADVAGSNRVGQNLAVISDCFLHLSLRLGYHFTMIDAFKSEDNTRNSVQFRFAGGVTGAVRRSRRARFLSEVLKNHNFSVTVQEDLVIARTKGWVAQDLRRVMFVLGIIVAYTRQLDVSMVNDASIYEHCENFDRIVNEAMTD
jgi:pyruvate,water dikinase